jgi:glucokinase
LKILAGDVGGTNSRMAVFEARGDRLEQLWTTTFPSRQQKSLVDVVRAAASESNQAIDAASFGVAGPVRDGVCRATNLPWTVDSRELATALSMPSVGLINDLEANAYGIAALAPADFLTLQRGSPDARGNAALISAGTGLGEAGLYWDGSAHHPFACEGGHASFAPDMASARELDLELLRWLAERLGHVSWERVISGPGLYNIYQFLRERGVSSEPPELAQRIANGDPGTAITQAALAGEFDLAVQALTTFTRLYGAEAGNIALKLMATGGVYIGGGIAPRIASWLQKPIFLDAFLDKGRMRPLLESMPVRVVLNDRTALLGAARHALRTRGRVQPAAR